ncbi:MAG TPA: phasin family protein, partial [Spirochaetia bacterium]|nr:phasin family protein [Spirochaetia bacterium]
LGAVTLTHEKAKAFVDDLISRGEVSKDEGVNLVQELLDKAQEQEAHITKKINAEIKRAVNSLGVASKEDIRKLEKKIEELSKKIDSK